jgi:hypothetical protein
MRGIIGAGGISSPARLAQPLRKGTEAFLGASSSPQFITVTSVSKDRIQYVTSHDEKTHVLERWIAEDLIARGTNTWLDSGYPKHFPELAKKLSKLVGRETQKELNMKKLKWTKGSHRGMQPFWRSDVGTFRIDKLPETFNNRYRVHAGEYHVGDAKTLADAKALAEKHRKHSRFNPTETPSQNPDVARLKRICMKG